MAHEQAVLRSRTGEALTLLGVSAQGRLTGLLLELTVEQRYRNPRDTNIETVYTFPLPHGAVLLGLDIELNGKHLSGMVVEKKAAEQIYEEAIEKGDTAVMLEQALGGLCTVNFGNLMPGEDGLIRYRYAQLQRFEQGRVRLAVPTVIAPRYGNPGSSGVASHQTPVSNVFVEYPFSITLDLEGDVAKGTVGSPTHPITVTPREGGLTVQLARDGYLDRDIVLVVEGLKGKSLAIVARDGEGYVALASLCPEMQRRSDHPAPMNLKILLDCSGSMAGTSIQAAKRALHLVLERLEPEDLFSLSYFGNQVEHLFPSLQKATTRSIVQAARKVDALDGTMGGTEMAKALQSVFQLNSKDSADILLITDGEIWKVEPLIEEAIRVGQRVFTIGVGNAPADSLLRRLAEATGGACELVAPNEDIEGAIVRMFSRLRCPRARAITAHWPAEPQWKTSIPTALFEGETLHLLAGFAAAPEGGMALTYQVGDSPGTQSSAITFGGRLQDTDTLPRLAAAERIKALVTPQSSKQHLGEDTEERRSIELALRYQLLTQWTNFLVIHERAEGEKAQGLPELNPIQQMLAAGWGGQGRVIAARSGGTWWQKSVHSLDGLPTEMLRKASASLNCMVERSDYLDIPAFLRGAGEKEVQPRPNTTPRDVLSLIRTGSTDNTSPNIPESIQYLKSLNVPETILNVLRALIDNSNSEAMVVRAFLEVLAELPTEDSITRHLRRKIREMFIKNERYKLLREHIREIFIFTTLDSWPVVKNVEVEKA